jgi:hypothetical protein
MYDTKLVEFSETRKGMSLRETERTKTEICTEAHMNSRITTNLKLTWCKNGCLLSDSYITLDRWKNYYFCQLLNVHRVTDVRQTKIHTGKTLAPRHRSEDNNKMDLGEIGWGSTGIIWLWTRSGGRLFQTW